MHTIDIPVTYKNKNLIFPATFLQVGYTYRFEVEINEITVSFEKDEEQNFRALVNAETINTANIDKELLKLIANSLTDILK